MSLASAATGLDTTSGGHVPRVPNTPSLHDNALALKDLGVGLLEDLQRMMSGYGDLLVHDLRAEMKAAQRTLALAVVAGGLAFTAVIAFAGAFALLLQSLTGLSLGASLAATGTLLALGAGATAIVARRTAQRPADGAAKTNSALSVVDNVQEDIAWMRQQRA